MTLRADFYLTFMNTSDQEAVGLFQLQTSRGPQFVERQKC